jgi:hypothetical protein
VISGTQRPLPDNTTTLTRDRHPCLLRNLNPQSQQANGRLRPRGHWDRQCAFTWCNKVEYIGLKKFTEWTTVIISHGGIQAPEICAPLCVRNYALGAQNAIYADLSSNAVILGASHSGRASEHCLWCVSLDYWNTGIVDSNPTS